MNRDRSLGWVVLTAVLVAPVVVYQYLPERGQPAPPPIPRANLIKPQDRFPKPRTDGKIVPAEMKAPRTVPITADDMPRKIADPAPSAEPGFHDALPPSDLPPYPEKPLRDPMLSPSEIYRLANPPEIPPPATHTPPAPPPPPKIEDQLPVTAIISGDVGAPKAIVNDQAVSVGDTIKKAKVMRITDDAVIFKYHGRTFQKKVGD